MQYASHVHQVAYVGAAPDQILADGLDVVYDEVKPAQGAGRHRDRREPGSEYDGARRPRRRELDDADAIPG